MVKFKEVINASLEWTQTILFRPFKLKKWLILTFVALLAGNLIGGCNSNYSGSSHDKEIKKAEASTTQQLSALDNAPKKDSLQTATNFKSSLKELKSSFKKPYILFLLILALLFLVMFIVILSYLSCRFVFIFLTNIIKNDASLKLPFRENKQIGNSLFLFTMAYAAVVFLIFIVTIAFWGYVLFKAGVFSASLKVSFLKVILISLPFIIFVILFTILLSLIYLIIYDFVVIVMLKDKTNFVKSCKKVIAVLKLNKRDFFIYILIKIGLGFCSAVLNSIISFISFFGLLLPGLGLIGLFYVIYLATPAFLQFIWLILGILIGVPIIIAWVCFSLLICLPFAVFFRTLSVKFFGRLDKGYDLFAF